jgi:hypothetical protein
MMTMSDLRKPYTTHRLMPPARMLNIFNERSTADCVSQHFFSWGTYDAVVQRAANRPMSVVKFMSVLFQPCKRVLDAAT